MVYLNPKLIDGEAEWGAEPAFHTPFREYVYPGRRVLELTGLIWAYIPEECPGSEEFGTTWLLEDTVLVCNGCGLDST